jgi:cell division protease FtsH
MKPKFTKNKKNFLGGGAKGLVILVTVFVVGIALLSTLTEVSQNIVHLSTTDFYDYVEQGKIESVIFSGQDVYGKLKDNQRFQARVPQLDGQLIDRMVKKGIKGDFASGSTGLGYLSSLLGLLFPLIIIGLLIFLYRMFKGSGGSQNGPVSGVLGLLKSRARLFMPSMVKERFSDVAGAYEAKDRLRDIIDFLKNPEKYRKLGAKIPRGILLIGEPGNGKTLLARAVAGEAGVPFFTITGSDFIEVFVGVGAARVRDLFAQARKNAPCIIFIDELDAIGRHRGSGLGGGHDEREQTLNQLLTELDGFENSQVPVVVMAATNIPEVLDKALLRPGRLDYQVEVPYPELKEREEVLRIHSRNKKFAESADLHQIAVDTSGFTCADLANLINFAAIEASKNGRSIIEQDDLRKALRKIFEGRESTNREPSLLAKGSGQPRMFMPSQVKVKFTDVAGLPEAKEELSDIIEYLKTPDRFTRVGARVPHGVLLVGDPGNGKTMLAKALAGEAKCPFFAASGAEFIEQFVGVGASRVRELFAQARKHAPCIVFIDEIDSVGMKRHAGNGGVTEYAQTLNQLLTEMDGFETGARPIIVVGATNRVDILDPALLRPGRFDRQVYVPYPSVEVRKEILAVHVRNKKLDPSVDLYTLARGTPGFSGAQLANLANEAALNAVNHNREVILLEDFEEARDKIMLGKQQRTIKQTKEELAVTAYHEAGHALINVLNPAYTDPLHKITILPRGGALGVTHSLPERDRYSYSREYMLAQIQLLLGGRAAEDLVFNQLTTGAANDFKHDTEIARKMVCVYGMSDLGQVMYNPSDFNYSEKTRERIDQEVQKIIDSAYATAKELLQKSREKLDKLAQTLLERETLYAQDVYQLLDITPRVDHRLGQAAVPTQAASTDKDKESETGNTESLPKTDDAEQAPSVEDKQD